MFLYSFRKSFEIIFLLALIFLISCKNKVPILKLEYRENKVFKNVQLEKIFEITHIGSIFWAIPFSDKVVVMIPEGRGVAFNIFIYDFSGKIIKERTIRGGEGPDELREISAEDIIFFNENEILSVEELRGYIKSIDLNTLEVRTIAKLSNILKGYGSKYVIPRFALNSIERYGKSCILGFIDSDDNYFENGKYYFVKFDGLFENFKLISTAKKKTMKLLNRKIKEEVRRKKIAYCDYYYILRTAIIFSVDWKNEFIYSIPAIEEPIIEAVSFDGKIRKRFEIDIDFEKFKVSKEKIEEWCDRVKSSPEPILKILKQVVYIPPHAPPLEDIKILDDSLFVVTGNRDWKKGENETLVYKLPEMEYEGSFYLPFPNTLKPAWFGNYYMTRNGIEKDGELCNLVQIYKVRVK